VPIKNKEQKEERGYRWHHGLPGEKRWEEHRDHQQIPKVSVTCVRYKRIVKCKTWI